MANSILQGNMPFDRSIYSKAEVDRIVEEHSHYIVSPAGSTYIRPTDEGNGVIDRTIEVNKYLSITFGVDPTTGKATIEGFIPAHDGVPKEIVWTWTAPDAPVGGNYVMDLVGPFTSKDGSQVYVPSTSPVHDGFDPEAFYANLWGEIVEEETGIEISIPAGTECLVAMSSGYDTRVVYDSDFVIECDDLTGGETIVETQDRVFFVSFNKDTGVGHMRDSSGPEFDIQYVDGSVVVRGTRHSDTSYTEVTPTDAVTAAILSEGPELRIRYKNFPQWFTFDERGNFEGHDAEMAEGSCQGVYYEDTPSEVISDRRVIATLDDITEVVGVKYATQSPLGESDPVDNVVTVFHMPSGVVAGNYGEESDRTVAPGESFVVTKNGVNATGHVTEESEVSITLDVSAGNVMMGYDSNDRTVSEVIGEIQEEIGGGGGGSITDRLDAVEGRLDSNDLRFDGIDARLDSNDIRLDEIDDRLDSNDEVIAGIKDDYVSKTDRNDQEVASNLLLSVPKVFALKDNTALSPEANYVDATTYQRHGIVVSIGTGPGERRLSLSYPNAEGNRTIATREDLLSSVLWSDLVALRGRGGLIPGAWYRITDYVATTVQPDTQSANHRFDIIVRADSIDKLNENAYAIKNADDTTYFINSKLEAWELKYRLDNDTARFAWADATNGKGVVYWMKDEFGNECPYDFKGITMKAYGDTDNVYRYTFDSGDASNNTDYSLSGDTQHVRNNVIRRYSSFNRRQLNRIVFKGGECYYNTFGFNCNSNTFGDDCAYNKFGDVCYGNTFGNGFFSNTFGTGCHSNTFGAECQNNTFGGGCTSNALGGGCSSNTFGDDCHRNKTGSYCKYNTFGDGCSGNTFGSSESSVLDYYQYIEFEPGVSNVVLHCDQSLSSESIYKNVVVLRGIGSVPITDHNVNQSFKTTYQPAGSQVISV